MKHKVTTLFFLVCNLISSTFELSCKDERNRNVDWFIIYKLPKISEESSGSLSEGKAYSYLTLSNSENWKLSTQDITSDRSMLGKTWQELKKKENTATYLFYNDDTPENFSGSAVGHLKGILAFDSRSGFWLSHSIPRFGRIVGYEYPESALTNGQHAFCVTFKTSELNEISNQLLYAHPNIYLKNLTTSVSSSLNEHANSLFSEKPAFIRSSKGKETFKRNSVLKSKGGVDIWSLAKDNQLDEDLYSDIIAPALKTSLYAETWQRGVGTYMPSACQTDYVVINVNSIKMNMTTRGRSSKAVSFKSTEDHSKWAISVDANQKWICMADMNRMVSQEKRGGGALCFQSDVVWKLFKDIISGTDNCAI